MKFLDRHIFSTGRRLQSKIYTTQGGDLKKKKKKKNIKPPLKTTIFSICALRVIGCKSSTEVDIKLP
jgi:hypothetical protein